MMRCLSSTCVCSAFDALEAMNLLPTAEFEQTLQAWFTIASVEHGEALQSRTWLLQRLRHQMRWRSQWEADICGFLQD